MKIFLLGAVATLLLSGCASKNAFSKLQMEPEQEKAVENTRSAKIISQDKVGGIFSAIYLNNIYNEIDKNTHFFYISTYLKEGNSDLLVLLNDERPLSTKKLPSSNKYSHLLDTNNKWTTNHLVTFTDTKSQDLNLSIGSGQFSSGLLKYSKDQQ